jgi:hypothetical protein
MDKSARLPQKSDKAGRSKPFMDHAIETIIHADAESSLRSGGWEIEGSLPGEAEFFLKV